MAIGACDTCGNAHNECECDNPVDPHAEEKSPPVICSECGSPNVQYAVWYRPNKKEVLDDYGSWDHPDTKWCEDCGSHQILLDPEVDPPGDYREAAAKRS